VTLGIPRLREIIMTASKTLKTPTMSVPLHDRVSEKHATKLTLSFTKLTLMELLASHHGVSVRETLLKADNQTWERAYFVTLKLHPAERIASAFDLSLRDIAKSVASTFVPAVSQLMKRELRRSATEGDISMQKVEGGKASNSVLEDDSGGGGGGGAADYDDGEERGKTGSAKRNNQNEADDLTDDEKDSDDEGGEEDGVAASKYSRSEDKEASYGGADDDEDVEENDNDRGLDNEMHDAEDFSMPNATPSSPAASYSFDDGSGVKIDHSSDTIMLQPLRVDPSARPLLMVGLVEEAATKTLVRSRKKIDQAFVNKEDGGRGRCLQTAGINFEELWKLDRTIVDHNRILSNDIWAIRQAYGVEAARNNIVQQIRSIFGAYGIEVDPRHLTLIADYMTFEGGYKAMNRIGMEQMSSTLLQMSFETTAHFLTQAALSGVKDELQSPSANIVLGRPIRHGTGAFDLLAKTVA
jgi:DNA-directed RNA polymerase I subunit RPA1